MYTGQEINYSSNGKETAIVKLKIGSNILENSAEERVLSTTNPSTYYKFSYNLEKGNHSQISDAASFTFSFDILYTGTDFSNRIYPEWENIYFLFEEEEITVQNEWVHMSIKGYKAGDNSGGSGESSNVFVLVLTDFSNGSVKVKNVKLERDEETQYVQSMKEYAGWNRAADLPSFVFYHNENEKSVFYNGETSFPLVEGNNKFEVPDEAKYSLQVYIYDHNNLLLDIDRENSTLGIGMPATSKALNTIDVNYNINMHQTVNDCRPIDYGETDSGKRWLDGRKIYKYTFVARTTGSGAHYFNKVDEEVGIIINYNWQRIFLQSEWYYRDDFPYISSSNYGISGVDGGGCVFINIGSTHAGTYDWLIEFEYVKKTDPITNTTVPFLSDSNMYGYVVTTSSNYNNSSHPGVNAFNGDYSNHWATTNTDNDRWIKIDLQTPLKNIKMLFTTPRYSGIAESHKIYGSNDDVEWTLLFEGELPFYVGTHIYRKLENEEGYRYIRINDKTPLYDTWTGYADIRIMGQENGD